MKQAHVIHYRRGPAWLAGKSVFEQPLAEHLAYMRSPPVRQVLRLGGPFLDDSGGLIVVDVADAGEATALAQADPAVRDGVMLAEVHPWKLLADAW